MTTQERNRVRTLRALLEANAKWRAERRKLERQDLQQLVDVTSTIDPDLKKELLYSWERGFVEDKPKGSEWNSQNLLRRDKNCRSGAPLTNPFKGKVEAESPKTITTAAGAVYRKSYLAKATTPLKNKPKEGTSQKEKVKSSLEEPKRKHQNKNAEQDKESESEEEDKNPFDEQTKDLFQNSDSIVTSRETPTGWGLNLAVMRTKPNQSGPVMGGLRLKNKWQSSPKERNKKRKKLQQQRRNFRNQSRRRQ